VSLSIGAQFGEPGGGILLLGTLRDYGRSAQKMEHLSFYGNSVRGTWRRSSSNGISKGRLWRRAFLSIGASFKEPGREPIYRGLWEMEEGAL